MIEWRWGLRPMTARDRNARNLAEVLDFSTHERPVTLPAFDPGTPRACLAPTSRRASRTEAFSAAPWTPRWFGDYP